MIPLAVPSLSERERKYLLECIESTFISSVGPFVERLETLVAEAAGADDAVATVSGTAGLHVALRALGVDRGDLVILPSYTFVASANAIAYCGADPWLLDVAADSWTLDPGRLAAALREQTERRGPELLHSTSGRRVAAIMPVYTLGLPADMDSIRATAHEFGLPVLADAAAALGALYLDRPLAGLADVTVFSFNGNKTITTGGGGAVVTKDRALLKQVRHLVQVARVGSSYEYDAVGFNYRMTNLHAAIGCAQLERRNELLEKKRALRAEYASAFRGLPGLVPFPEPDWAQSACWLSGVVLERGSHPRLKEACEMLVARGIEAREFWRPLHLQAPYQSCPRGLVGVAEDLWDRVLVLPSSSDLSAADQRRVIDAVRTLVA